MKDLDFDELDRAVSTLMNDVPKADLVKSDKNQTKTLSISPTISDTETSAPEQTTPPPQSPSPQPAPVIPPAARRGGRFMDVVHRSSDMKKDKSGSPQTVSRQGVTIEPVKSTPSLKKVTPPVPESTPAVEKELFSSPASEEPSTQKSDWPDPLEMSGLPSSAPDKSPTVGDQPHPMSLLEEGNEIVATAPTSEDLQPLTSPFLSGTKVEKRPLGSSQVSDADEASELSHVPVDASAETTKTADDPSDQLPASPDMVKKELPPELQGDLVAIESGSATENTVPEEPKLDEVKTPVETPKEPQTPTVSHPTALLEATTVDDEPAFTGPTSIAQQYREEPNTGDQKNGAIYDTDTYHKPLAHPAKKKSGWLWVVWIVLILLIGAGAGAALYFLRII